MNKIHNIAFTWGIAWFTTLLAINSGNWHPAKEPNTAAIVLGDFVIPVLMATIAATSAIFAVRAMLEYLKPPKI